VIWRRVDSDFVDPLELNGKSRLVFRSPVGDAARPHRGQQRAGSGFAESRALMSFMRASPSICWAKSCALPNIATWWCGDREAQPTCLRFDDLAISGAFGNEIPGFAAASRCCRAICCRPTERALREAVETAAGLCRAGSRAALHGSGLERRPIGAPSVFAARVATATRMAGA